MMVLSLLKLKGKKMPKYTVVFVSYGYVDVETDNEDKAIEIAYATSTWDHFETPEHIRVFEVKGDENA